MLAHDVAIFLRDSVVPLFSSRALRHNAAHGFVQVSSTLSSLCTGAATTGGVVGVSVGVMRGPASTARFTLRGLIGGATSTGASIGATGATSTGVVTTSGVSM